MVDRYSEGACQVLPQKASPWASTENVQRIHSETTLSIAPCTPMQASLAWHKPHESPDSLPSLSLVSSELKGSTPLSYSSSQQIFSARPGAVGSSTPSHAHGRLSVEIKREGYEYLKEDLIPFSLSKYEKRYQAEHKSESSNPWGTYGDLQASPQHIQAAAGGYTRGSSSEMYSSSAWHSFHSHKDSLNSGLKLLNGTSPPQLDTLAVLSKDPQDLKSDSEPVNAPPSVAPGEVANNAYKLYSEMFPSTGAAVTACLFSPTQNKGTLHFPRPYPEHKNVMQLLPVMYNDKQVKAETRSNHINDFVESAKKPKFRENAPLSLLEVKQEPDVEPDTKACHAMSFSSPRVEEHSLDRGETRIIPLKRECLEHGGDWIDSKHSDQLYPDIGSCPELANVINAFPSSKDMRCQVSALATTAPMKKVQPLDGVKLVMSSKHAQGTQPFSTFSMGEASIGVLSQPSTTVANGVGEATAHGSFSAEVDWGKFLALSATPAASPAETAITSILPCQKRFDDLQAFLKRCDESDPSEHMQALRSLSAAARSGYAVQLETRAIRLSLEEGKEMKRMRLLNVLGRNPERSLDEAGSTPRGPRLPAPGGTSYVKNVA